MVKMLGFAISNIWALSIHFIFSKALGEFISCSLLSWMAKTSLYMIVPVLLSCVDSKTLFLQVRKRDNKFEVVIEKSKAYHKCDPFHSLVN